MEHNQKLVFEIRSNLKNSIHFLYSEGLDEHAKQVANLVNQIDGKGFITSTHKASLYSTLRMMLESNTYSKSLASRSLDDAYELIMKALS
ncbi:hypothetical protein [Photobacterium leiognathi]|uniref:hypothetical protein n=1 Tax=Photobacterium leiognathi TaxID=553611 RepID=UPI00298170B1|nr:hypothetical protein [Photobacterium leiognathi]